MPEIEHKIVEQLCEIVVAEKIDWSAFDDVLDTIEDINILSDDKEDSYLTELILNVRLKHNVNILPEVIRHFFIKGYDASANDGLNGGLGLQFLFWYHRDACILEAAKMLLHAGAAMDYPIEDDGGSGLTGLMADLDWHLSGAWAHDKDYVWANILEAYLQIAKAAERNISFEGIDVFSECIGKRLERIELVGDRAVLSDEHRVTKYEEALIFWFDGKPLVISQYADLVINPVFVSDNQHRVVDISHELPYLPGCVLKEITYVNQITCYFDFDNGQRLMFTSIIGEKDRYALYELGTAKSANLTHLAVNTICCMGHENSCQYVKRYLEETIALFTEDCVKLLYMATNGDNTCYIDAIECSWTFAKNFNQRIPVEKPEKTELYYDGDSVTAMHFYCGDYSVYVEVDQEPGLELRLCQGRELLYCPFLLEELPALHIDFQKRQDKNIFFMTKTIQ